MKETDFNSKSLQWFLDFLTVNLDTTDIREITYFAQWHFLNQWPHFPFVGVKDYFHVDEEEVRRDYADKGYTEAVGTGWPDKETLIEVQKNLRKVVDVLVAEKTATFKVTEGDILFSKGTKGFSFGFKLDLPLKRDYDLETTKLIARLSLYRLLFLLPEHIIGKCRECGKYFISLTAKPKYFCTPQCASINTARRRRTEDPEAHRAKQRKLMRRKYAKKKAKKLGISFEEALKTYEEKDK